jgi:hypothetical protein
VVEVLLWSFTGHNHIIDVYSDRNPDPSAYPAWFFEILMASFSIS